MVRSVHVMVWTLLKWVLPALVLVAVAGALFTRKTFHVETVIAATPKEVWAVLTDTASFPEWNPVFIEVEGAYTEGGKVRNKVRDPDGKILEMISEIRVLRPAREIRQYGGLPGIITFDHQWILEPVPTPRSMLSRLPSPAMLRSFCLTKLQRKYSSGIGRSDACE